MPEITIDFSQVGATELTEEMARFLSRANCFAAMPAVLHDEHGYKGSTAPKSSTRSTTGGPR